MSTQPHPDVQEQLRAWLEKADDPAQRAWLRYRNTGFIAMVNSVNFLRIKNQLSAEDQLLLEVELRAAHRDGFELARDAYREIPNG